VFPIPELASHSQRGIAEMAIVKKEIHSRDADGITVSLFAHFEDSDCVEISCHVTDSRTGTDFTISDIPKNKALEAFYHPFATGEKLLTAGVI
jgi:hypothetical protein